ERLVVGLPRLSPGVRVRADQPRDLVIQVGRGIARDVEARMIVGLQQGKQVVRDGPRCKPRRHVAYAKALLRVASIRKRVTRGGLERGRMPRSPGEVLAKDG